MEVDRDGMLTGDISILAQNRNDDFTEDPVGFEQLRRPGTKIDRSAATPLNGPDGLALDSRGRIWVASVFGDNLTVSWLRVSGTAEMPQIDQCVGHQFHPVVPLLFELKAQQHPLEFIFPREGPLHA
jgi:hypothetical protein